MLLMRCSILALGALLSFSLRAQPVAPLTLEQIMAEPDWIGAAVESPYWGLDGKRVLYSQKRSDGPLRDLYAIGLEDGVISAVPDEDRGMADAANAVYHPGRKHAVFLRNGDLYWRDLRSGALTQLTATGNVTGTPVFSTDGLRVIFRQGQDWYLTDLGAPMLASVLQLKAEKDPGAEPKPDILRDIQMETSATLARRHAERKVRQERENALRAAEAGRPQAPYYLGEDVSISSSALSPDLGWALVVTEDKKHDKGQAGKMPVYVTESGYEEIEDARTRVGRNSPSAQKLWLIDRRARSVTQIPFDALPGIDVDPLAELRRGGGKKALEGLRPVRINGVQFSDDGSRAAVMLRAVDNKDRWIASVEAGKPALKPLHRLTDPGWINWNFNDFGWLPDNRTLWLLSEESGHSHLYTVAANGRAKALTRGNWEASAPQLSADGRRFYFLCNRAWPGDYEICAKDIAKGAVREITALDGVEAFSLSPDGQSLLVSYSGSYLPTQLALVPAEGGQARILTDTRSEQFRALAWLEPRFEQVPSSHVQAPIWSKLYRPQALEAGRKYPIVLFVHGAGYTQNTHARHPYYFREQMFHNLLVQQGYLVLDMDYRASEGYGRDWRTAIYRNFGKPELEDLIDGVNWLVENQQGDPERVGVYGGSYGGFMTLIAMFKAPDVFKAGAALRPVTDWSQYNHGYTANILNTPDIDPQPYHDGSPIFFAEGLQGDLLIAHGMMDNNVFYQDSVRLAQRLIELKKENWELASYPLERHGFVEADAWLDEYRRIFKLFERSLKPGG